jgi:hypothetical protein
VFLKRYGITNESDAEDAEIAVEDAGVPLEGGISVARTAYHGQPAIKALRADERTSDIWDIEDYLMSREKYIQDACDGAISTFAVVKDGEWHERGSMGWFGCVSGEKDKGDWFKQVSDMLDSLPDDTLLTVCDCHI